MAEPLKASFAQEVVARLATAIAKVDPAFNRAAFEADALAGFEALELMARGQRVAETLRRHLPPDYARALEILVSSCRVTPRGDSQAMASFFWLPHTLFVGRYGLSDEDFDRSMEALHKFTQLFTGEFGIRSFLERHPERTLSLLRRWTRDPSAHVRRLVSEGTRPRLPWATQLQAFRADPSPILPLLEALKDDPSDYVRRSVANNLNDIGKDHPELLLDLSARWLVDASTERRQLVSHALRSLTRAGDARALQLMGFGEPARVRVERAVIEPAAPRIGESVQIWFELVNEERKTQALRIDLRVTYVKADGSTRPRVFALKSLPLGPGARHAVARSLSLEQMSTRTHYPGQHEVEVILNGKAHKLGYFTLRGPSARGNGARPAAGQ